MRILKNWRVGPAPPRSPQITSQGIAVDVVRKRIKHFYLRVQRPHGRVQISAPHKATDDEVDEVVARRIGWIQRQQAKVAAAPPHFRPKYVSGEIHFFLGRPHRLEVVEHDGRRSRVARSGNVLTLSIRRRSRLAEREQALGQWYRGELKLLIPPLVANWQPVMNVKVAESCIKRMRTRWGTCNIRARRIWLNLELAKFPVECLEYVVVHEMVHLFERNHNVRFKSLMDAFLPDWPERQRTLGGRLAGHYKQGHGDDDQIDTCD